MKFTKEVPTVRGFYLWRMNEWSSISNRFVFDETYCQAGSTRTASCTIGGEWCLLVPAEEVENAYMEAVQNTALAMTDIRFPNGADAWNNSRAKRVMEGKE